MEPNPEAIRPAQQQPSPRSSDTSTGFQASMEPTARPGSVRVMYSSSGRVNWPLLLPCLMLFFASVGLLSVFMHICYLNGYYYMFATPLLVGMLMLAPGFFAVGAGQCRNSAIAASVGVSGSLLLILGFYYAGLVHSIGMDGWFQLDMLPSYIIKRWESDQWDRVGGNIMSNVLILALQMFLLMLIVCPLFVGRSRRAFLEKDRCWTSYELATVAAGSGSSIVENLQNASLISVLPFLEAVQVQYRVPYCELVLEYSPRSSLDQADPVYLSIRETNDKVGRSARMNHYSPLIGKYLIRQWQLTPEEVRTVRHLFPRFRARQEWRADK